MNRQDICFHIRLVSAYPEHPQSPFIPHKFEFESEEWPSTDAKTGETTRDAFFKVTINNFELHTGWVPAKSLPPPGLDTPLPQWPWVFGQCCLSNDINPIMARSRLSLLTVTLLSFKDNGILNAFIAPKIDVSFEMTWQSMDRWMRFAYPIVGSIKSRFHPSCDFVSRDYGHLLL